MSEACSTVEGSSAPVVDPTVPTQVVDAPVQEQVQDPTRVDVETYVPTAGSGQDAPDGVPKVQHIDVNELNNLMKDIAPNDKWGDAKDEVSGDDTNDGVLSDRSIPQTRSVGGRGRGRGERGRGRGGDRGGGRGRGRGGDRGPGGRGGGKTPGYYQSRSGGQSTPPTGARNDYFSGRGERSNAALWKVTATISGKPVSFIVAGVNPADARDKLLESYKSRAFEYTDANLWSTTLEIEGPTDDGFSDTKYSNLRELFEKGYVCRVKSGALII